MRGFLPSGSQIEQLRGGLARPTVAVAPEVGQRFMQHIGRDLRGKLPHELAATIVEIVLGFVVGVVLALAVGHRREVYR